MEVKINLQPEELDEILSQNGYVVENVCVTFDRNKDTYSHGSEKKCKPDYGKYFVKVAYKFGEKPKYLDVKDKPLMGVHYTHTYDYVIQELIKKKFIKLLCN